MLLTSMESDIMWWIVLLDCLNSPNMSVLRSKSIDAASSASSPWSLTTDGRILAVGTPGDVLDLEMEGPSLSSLLRACLSTGSAVSLCSWF